ncbi:carbohydrate ABC transporter permease [Paenibacillus nasutitermitis]|uniref:Sugar ABC transporter permease n=1 Tax=Paenibacillus nasutitermitis TaxID=1652958 RepID=A0A916YN62_9BACL|nr:carbohydrate ABC transporter permease [Paenibacillus nasutitermitis]GGD53314.1 sugar ABC transporter permease [Paenibacillus nasutitermitis]
MKHKVISPPVRWVFRFLLLLWTFFAIYPLIFSVFQSLKDNEQFFTGKSWELPDLPLLWSNFSYTWEKYHFGSYFINTTIITAGSIVLTLILTSTTAYILARFSFRGSGFLYYIYLAGMTIPSMMIVVPMFFLFNDLHLNNSYSGLILLYSITAFPLGLLVLMGFFKSLPRELEESAVIDGASLYGVFFKVMLPLAMPGLVTISIINLLNFWNEYQYALILMNDALKYTLPVGLAFMQGEMQYRIEFGPLFAGLLISTIPVLIIYIIFQNRINDGIVAGAVK